MTRLHLMTWSLERSPVKSRLSRVPWSRSPRAPPVGASYTGASLRRSRSVPWPVALDVQLSGPIIMLLLFGRRGHRTNQYCNPLPGSPLWVLALVAKSSRSSDRCLLHWRPPCGALDRFLGRVYSTYSLAILWWCCRPGRLFFCSSADAGTDKSVL